MKMPADEDGQEMAEIGPERSQHKPELPLPRLTYGEFMAAQEDEKVHKALQGAQDEARRLREEGKIRT